MEAVWRDHAALAWLKVDAVRTASDAHQAFGDLDADTLIKACHVEDGAEIRHDHIADPDFERAVMVMDDGEEGASLFQLCEAGVAAVQNDVTASRQCDFAAVGEGEGHGLSVVALDDVVPTGHG